MRATDISAALDTARPAIGRISAEVWDLAEISLRPARALVVNGSTEALADLVHSVET